MKLIKNLFVVFTLVFWASCLFADNTQFQVRLVLDVEEAQTISNDVLHYTSPSGQDIELAIANDIILSVEDVQYASIRLQEDLLKKIPDGYWTIGPDGYKELHYSEQDKLNLTADPRIEFTLTQSGKKKFEDFTKNNLRKSVAIIGNNRVLAKVMIMEPISSGVLQILSPTNKVNDMAKCVEGMGLKLKVKP